MSSRLWQRLRASSVGDATAPVDPPSGDANIYLMGAQSNGGQAGATTYIASAPYLAGTGIQYWYWDGAVTGSFQDITLPASDGDFDNTRNFVYNPGGSQTGAPNFYENLIGWGGFEELVYQKSQTLGAVNTYAIPVWQGGLTIGNWAVGFPMWSQLTAALTDAKAAVDALPKNWVVKEKLWIQGESDATVTLAPLYQGKLEDLITRVRALTEIPANLKWVIVKLRRDAWDGNATYAPYVHIIRGAQNRIAYDDANAYLIEPEDVGGVLAGDDLHYTAAGQLAIGQAAHNQTYLTLSAEWQDLFAAGYNGEDAANAIQARYSTDGVYNPVAFATYAALFSGEGDEFRDPTFLTKIKVANTGINQINSERPHQNCDNTKWFHRTGTNYQIFSNSGTKIGGTISLNFEGQNPQDTVRWHQTNPDILVYIKDDHIIYYDTGGSPPSTNPYIAATSPNGTLGTGSPNRRLAGGDGNIAVKVGTECWLLITHGGTNTNAQVLVLGDPDNPQTNDWKIVSHNWTGTEWELQYETWDVSATKWDFPTGSGFDYATLTLEDPADGWPYIVTAIDGEGTDLYNLSGTKIDDIDSNANHMDQVKAQVGGTEYLAIVKKTVAGMIPPAVNVGDAQCWYYEVDTSATPMTVTINGFVGLDWGSGFNQAGGGQYSSYASNRTSLLAMNSAVEEGATDWQAYYSEIVEIQLDRDASDNVPRRLLHHMIDTFGSVGGQPEVWYSNDGTHGFFKTDVGGQLSGDGYLFWFEIPERTPVSQR